MQDLSGVAELSGAKTLKIKKPGKFTADIIFEHPNYLDDVEITGCEFEISYLAFSGETITGFAAGVDPKDYAILKIPAKIGGQKITKIFRNAFALTSIQVVKIEDGITRIEQSCFNGAVNLTSITLPKTLTILESTVFARCLKLTKLQLPEGLFQIGSNLLFQASVKTLTIPRSVMRIETTAFLESNLEEVIILNPNAYKRIPDGRGSLVSMVGFLAFTSVKKIKVPAAKLEDFKKALGWKPYKDIIEGY